MPPRFDQIESVLREAHGLLEGPAWTDSGVVFSDVMLGGVWEIDDEGGVTQVLERRRGIGGIVALNDGGLAVSGRDISLVHDGKLETLYEDPDSFGFNDIAADQAGNLLAGVLRYRPLQGDDPVPGELIQINSAGNAETVAEDIIWPNGIAVREDGTILVSDYSRGHVKAIPAGGGDAEVFFELEEGSPDGLALDASGGLWVAGGPAGNLTRVDPDGTVGLVVDVPASFVSSLCFAGPWLDQIHITTADSLEEPELGGTVLVTDLGVPGAVVPRAF